MVTRRLEGKGWRQLEKGGQKMQTSNYKVNKYQECNIQNDDYDIVIYQKKYLVIWMAKYFLIYTVFGLWLASKVEGHLVTLRALCLWNLIHLWVDDVKTRLNPQTPCWGLVRFCLWLQKASTHTLELGQKPLMTVVNTTICCIWKLLESKF